MPIKQGCNLSSLPGPGNQLKWKLLLRFLQFWSFSYGLFYRVYKDCDWCISKEGKSCELSTQVVYAHYQGQETCWSESYFYVFCDFDGSNLFHTVCFNCVLLGLMYIEKKDLIKQTGNLNSSPGLRNLQM